MARTKEVTILTRLGERRIDQDRIIYFPRGLAGFEGLHEFVLLQIRPDAPLLVLQSVDKADVGLLVADPFSFMQDFTMRVGDAEQKLLRIHDVKQTAVLVTVTIPNGKPEETRLNLTGPILINHEARLGLQIPQADENMPAQMLLNSIPKEERAQEQESFVAEPEQQAPIHEAAPTSDALSAENEAKKDSKKHVKDTLRKLKNIQDRAKKRL